MDIKNRQILLSIIGIAILIIGLVGITYSFFNYTRTGSVNNMGTGRIYFNSTQNGTLNLTNIFPVKSSEVDASNLDAVTITIVGDTTYSDGEEYLISLTGLNNTVNGKTIPINYIATYEETTGKTIGTSRNDYWSKREDKDANIYRLVETGIVEEDKQVLVGFIKNDNTGISGTLTIKAYIDGDRIAISDTYPENEPGYLLNPNMTQNELNNCMSYLNTGIWNGFSDYLDNNGESLEEFCNGTGIGDGSSFQEWLDFNEFAEEDLEYFVEHNIIIYRNYSNGTSDDWVNGRTVLTTSEWNSLGTTPISFKIKAESNEGIWVDYPSGTIGSCPECKFIYPSTPVYTTWNKWEDENGLVSPTIISNGLFDDYRDLVDSLNTSYFLGVKLNSNNQVTNVYACGVRGDIPFCIEGTLNPEDGGISKYDDNRNLLQRKYLWNNTCEIIIEDEGTIYESERAYCPKGSLEVAATTYSYGYVDVGVYTNDYHPLNSGGFCYVMDGLAKCSGIIQY